MNKPETDLPMHLIRSRHAWELDERRSVVALELPGEVVIVGLYVDGVLVRMLDDPGQG